MKVPLSYPPVSSLTAIFILSVWVVVSCQPTTLPVTTFPFTDTLLVTYSEGVVTATNANGSAFATFRISSGGVTTVRFFCNAFPSLERVATTYFVGYDTSPDPSISIGTSANGSTTCCTCPDCNIPCDSNNFTVLPTCCSSACPAFVTNTAPSTTLPTTAPTGAPATPTVSSALPTTGAPTAPTVSSALPTTAPMTYPPTTAPATLTTAPHTSIDPTARPTMHPVPPRPKEFHLVSKPKMPHPKNKVPKHRTLQQVVTGPPSATIITANVTQTNDNVGVVIDPSVKDGVIQVTTNGVVNTIGIGGVF